MMATSSIHRGAPNLCSICVDALYQDRFYGRLYHYYQPEATPFSNQMQMVEQIEQLCNQLNYPQAAEQMRAFQGGQPTQRRQTSRREKKMEYEKLMEQKGKKATFVVHVTHRQNATWQGNVVWAEKDQKASFRSALELIKLIDSAVEEHLAPAEE